MIDGRLYLFRHTERRAQIRQAPALAAEAEVRWPALDRLTEATPPD